MITEFTKRFRFLPGTFFAFAPTLLLTALPMAHGGEKVVFSEDFESSEVGKNISEPNPSAESRWRASGNTRGESPGQSIATEGKGENSTTVAVTTPAPADGIGGGTTYNITTNFPEIGGTVRVSVDVYPEGGSGQIMVRNRSGNTSGALALIQFRGGSEMGIRAYSGNSQGEKVATNIGQFRFKRWYKVSITLHLNGTAPTYDVEIADATNAAATVRTSGIESPAPGNSVSNLLLGSMFSKDSRFGWDNIVVEKMD